MSINIAEVAAKLDSLLKLRSIPFGMKMFGKHTVSTAPFGR